MPITNLSSGDRSPHRLFCARTPLQRLLGFLALIPESGPRALLIRTCSGIHTFSLPWALGVAFLDREGRVLRLEPALPPGRIIAHVRQAQAVLEWPADQDPLAGVRVGDQLDLLCDAAPRASALAWRQFLHFPCNILMGLLWSGFVLAALNSWLLQRTPTGVGLLAYNTLLVYLFLTRRPSAEISARGMDWVVAIATVVLSFLLKPGASGSVQGISLLLQAGAILIILAALASLGKSFGIVPANRQVKTSGAYRLVRHPLYAGELAFLAAFLLGNPGLTNLLIGTLIAAGQIYRALAEERLLAHDPEYGHYMAQVPRRFIPYLF